MYINISELGLEINLSVGLKLTDDLSRFAIHILFSSSSLSPLVSAATKSPICTGASKIFTLSFGTSQPLKKNDIINKLI